MKRFGLATVCVIFAAFCIFTFSERQALAVGPGKTLTWQGGGQGQVVFEGKKHAKEGHGCKDCHPGLFSMKYGTAKITMAAMDKGELCGACHNGKTAFATNDTKKCHECHKRQDKHDKHEGHDGHKKSDKHHGDDH